MTNEPDLEAKLAAMNAELDAALRAAPTLPVPALVALTRFAGATAANYFTLHERLFAICQRRGVDPVHFDDN